MQKLTFKSKLVFLVTKEIISKSPEKYGKIEDYTDDEIEMVSNQLLTINVVDFLAEYQRKINNYFNIPLDDRKLYLKDQTVANIKSAFKYYRAY